jgi:8-amino-7-oxononanoate synthase
VHCSPPSAADLHAAGHALAVNREHGDALRKRLAGNVALFRGRLREAGVPVRGGGLPTQTLEIRASHARGVHERLAQRGIRAVLRQDRHCGAPLVSLIVTAAHEPEAIEQVVQTLLAILPRGIRTG